MRGVLCESGVGQAYSQPRADSKWLSIRRLCSAIVTFSTQRIQSFVSAKSDHHEPEFAPFAMKTALRRRKDNATVRLCQTRETGIIESGICPHSLSWKLVLSNRSHHGRSDFCSPAATGCSTAHRRRDARGSHAYNASTVSIALWTPLR